MKYDNLSKPLGVNEIATLLDVKPDTVSSWQLRKIFPKPDAYINDMKTRIWSFLDNASLRRIRQQTPQSIDNYAQIGSYDDSKLN